MFYAGTCQLNKESSCYADLYIILAIQMGIGLNHCYLCISEAESIENGCMISQKKYVYK
jgi:hypothetical protein